MQYSTPDDTLIRKLSSTGCESWNGHRWPRFVAFRGIYSYEKASDQWWRDFLTRLDILIERAWHALKENIIARYEALSMAGCPCAGVHLWSRLWVLWQTAELALSDNRFPSKRKSIVLRCMILVPTCTWSAQCSKLLRQQVLSSFQCRFWSDLMSISPNQYR